MATILHPRDQPVTAPPPAGARARSERAQADTVFAALAHPVRRQILLCVHYRGSARAGEIARRLECSWPTTSRHLAVLVGSGLLSVETAGRERVYRANSTRLIELFEGWLGYLR